MLNPDPQVNDMLVKILQRDRNVFPQFEMPPCDAAYDAAAEEIERAEFDRDNVGERFDGLS